MSPDNWERNPVVVKLIKTASALTEALPNFCNLALADPTDFRGLTIFLGDTNDFVAGVRRFSDDGTPEVMWSSGTTVLECLINLDKKINAGKWREDKSPSR